MNLATFWFILIATLWAGYFVLEGFDFGVGMLLPFLGRSERERSAMFESIGPVWDGNEVWLVVAGGATFAAFPGWYASLFSGFYLALFIVLVGLIVRGVARDEQPHLVAVPHRRDGAQQDAPLGSGAPDRRREHPDAEVEALEHEVAGPENDDQEEPECLQVPVPVGGGGEQHQ